MNFFGIGGTELILIVLIMLVVAGPKRMAQWAYTVGQYTTKLRHMWTETMTLIQKELDDAGVDVKLPKEPTRQGLNKAIQEMVEPVAKPMKETMQQAQSELDSVKSTSAELDKLIKDTVTKENGSAGKANGKTSTPDKPASNLGAWSQHNAPDDDELGSWSGPGKTEE